MWKYLAFTLLLVFKVDLVVSNSTTVRAVMITVSPTKDLESHSNGSDVTKSSSSKNASDDHSKEGNKTFIPMIISGNSTKIENITIPIEGGGTVHVNTTSSLSYIKGTKLNVSDTQLSPVKNDPFAHPKVSSVIFEGGELIHLGVLNNSAQSNITSKPTPEINLSTTSATVIKVSEERKISARKGVDNGDMPPSKPLLNTTYDIAPPMISKINVSSVTAIPIIESTTHKVMKKPKFTMIIGDHESKERKSFIESPTTGKDYVFPLVLTIMALPLILLAVKLIYKRGSEYTERRHYDRMYLIDGMYNAR